MTIPSLFGHLCVFLDRTTDITYCCEPDDEGPEEGVSTGSQGTDAAQMPRGEPSARPSVWKGGPVDVSHSTRGIGLSPIHVLFPTYHLTPGS